MITTTGTLAVKAGRHPILENIQSAATLVPNDVFASGASAFQIIQGPVSYKCPRMPADPHPRQKYVTMSSVVVLIIPNPIIACLVCFYLRGYLILDFLCRQEHIHTECRTINRDGYGWMLYSGRICELQVSSSIAERWDTYQASCRIYDSLLTRLSNGDDLERSLSTFSNEMVTASMILGCPCWSCTIFRAYA